MWDALKACYNYSFFTSLCSLKKYNSVIQKKGYNIEEKEKKKKSSSKEEAASITIYLPHFSTKAR